MSEYVSNVKKNICKRCGTEEYIPTHQHVKFDEKVNDLCVSCWYSFRSWFNHYEKNKKT